MTALKAPFPWFGGKRAVAEAVWDRLGRVENFIEPFAGSLAVLLLRPDPPQVETVSDLDCYVSNFWRATQHDPEAVVDHADGPVNECVPAGTMIATPTGDIPVENVVPGMTVWGERAGRRVLAKVLGTQQSTASDFVVLGSLWLTGNHPVWTYERGYVEARYLSPGLHVCTNYPVSEADLPMLQCLHENLYHRTTLADLHPDRSTNQTGSLCWSHISREETTERASFASDKGRANAPRLLDSFSSYCGLTATVGRDRDRRRRWMGRTGTGIDCCVQTDEQSCQSHRWRGGIAGLRTNAGTSPEVVEDARRREICSGSAPGHAGPTPFFRGGGEDSISQQQEKAGLGGESKNLAGTPGQKTFTRTSREVSRSEARKEAHRRAQSQDCRINHRAQANCLRGNRADFPFGQAGRANDWCFERIAQPGVAEGLSLQRASLSFRVTVYNFQTDTGNYFADGILVHNCDLHSRHRYLVLSDDAEAFRQRMRTDPDYYDCRIAGWWCWGLCCWIGSGWCAGGEEWEQRPKVQCGGLGSGVHGQADLTQKRPLIAGDNPGSHGKGVHAKGELSQQVPAGQRPLTGVHTQPNLSQQLPKLQGYNSGCVPEDSGTHLSIQIPRLTNDLALLAGPSRGNRPQLADAHSRGRGVHSNDSVGTCAERRAWLLDWFGRLRDRLRTVRVCCGDWSRVCSSDSVTTRLGTTGVFLDPPYSAQAGRSMKLYAQESGTVAHEVRDWCLANGSRPQMRICLCGYEGEGHEVLLEHGWMVCSWEAQGGYGNRSGKGRANRKRERIWFSPHCVNDGPLFAVRNEDALLREST